MRWSRMLTGTLVAACLMAAVSCGPQGYRALDQQQADECDGIPAVPAGQLRLLDPKSAVTGVTLCTTPLRYRPGQGIWQTRVTTHVPADRIPAVVAALTAPDSDPPGACDAMLLILPSFSVTLSDGTKLRPGVPGDGCHVSTAATELMSAPGAPETVAYLRMTVPQVALTAGCDTAASQPAVWLPSPGFQPMPKGDHLSLCRYRSESGPADKGGPLVAAGSARSSTVIALWNTAAATPPAGCRPSGNVMQAPTEGWLMVAAPPDQPLPPAVQNIPGLDGAKIVALVELGGCHRLVGPGKTGLRYADPAVTAALARLTTPVQVPPPPTR